MANELHTMPLKIERLMSSQRVRALELDEFGAYIKLLSDAWLNGGFLHRQCLRNANALQRLCGCNAEQAERIQKNVIEEFFVEAEDGSLYNPSQVEIYKEVAQSIKAKKDRAAKGAAARWKNTSNAQAMLKQCQPKPKPKPNNSGGTTKKFKPPTVEEVRAYCKERSNTIEPERFVNHYEAKGWFIGKNKMKDWKACVRTWEGKQKEQPGLSSGHYIENTPNPLD